MAVGFKTVTHVVKKDTDKSMKLCSARSRQEFDIVLADLIPHAFRFPSKLLAHSDEKPSKMVFPGLFNWCFLVGCHQSLIW